MPFYADSQFNTPVLVSACGLMTASLTGTGTAVTGLLLPATSLPTFIRRTLVKNILIQINTAPNSGQLANLVFSNGTNVIGTATIGTQTAGQIVTLAVTSNGTFAAAGTTVALLGTAVGTATSAGTAAGIYAIWLDQQELYA